MNIGLFQDKFQSFRRVISIIILTAFGLSSVSPSQVYAQSIPQAILNLPVPGSMVNLSAAFNPIMVRGITLYPDNPLKFDFIIDRGEEKLSDEVFKEQSSKIIKYFLASLTTPEDQMWVNLSPYEKNRIIPENFGKTEMGRDLLAQDYMLKQLTASLMYPEDELGKQFWDRVYKKAQEKFGNTDIPMNTFNKIWIVPENASIYEHEKGAFIVKSHLKVMLEEDYLALEISKKNNMYGAVGVQNIEPLQSGISLEIVREILIPEIEKEVNEGKTFVNLRQIYNASILATWYKKNLKQSLLGQIYVDQGKTDGVNQSDPAINQKIYDQYIEAFKKGVYDYIKEDVNESTGEIIPRKYFSGGAIAGVDESILTNEQDGAVISKAIESVDASKVTFNLERDLAQTADSAKQADIEEKFTIGDVLSITSGNFTFQATVVSYRDPKPAEISQNRTYVVRLKNGSERNIYPGEFKLTKVSSLNQDVDRMLRGEYRKGDRVMVKGFGLGTIVYDDPPFGVRIGTYYVRLDGEQHPIIFELDQLAPATASEALDLAKSADAAKKVFDDKSAIVAASELWMRGQVSIVRDARVEGDTIKIKFDNTDKSYKIVSQQALTAVQTEISKLNPGNIGLMKHILDKAKDLNLFVFRGSEYFISDLLLEDENPAGIAVSEKLDDRYLAVLEQVIQQLIDSDDINLEISQDGRSLIVTVMWPEPEIVGFEAEDIKIRINLNDDAINLIKRVKNHTYNYYSKAFMLSLFNNRFKALEKQRQEIVQKSEDIRYINFYPVSEDFDDSSLRVVVKEALEKLFDPNLSVNDFDYNSVAGVANKPEEVYRVLVEELIKKKTTFKKAKEELFAGRHIVVSDIPRFEDLFDLFKQRREFGLQIMEANGKRVAVFTRGSNYDDLDWEKKGTAITKFFFAVGEAPIIFEMHTHPRDAGPSQTDTDIYEEMTLSTLKEGVLFPHAVVSRIDPGQKVWWIEEFNPSTFQWEKSEGYEAVARKLLEYGVIKSFRNKKGKKEEFDSNEVRLDRAALVNRILGKLITFISNAGEKLEHQPNADIRDAVLKRLNSPDWKFRLQATEEIIANGLLIEEIVMLKVVDLMNDQYPEIKKVAAALLVEVDNPKVTKRLIEWFFTDRQIGIESVIAISALIKKMKGDVYGQLESLLSLHIAGRIKLSQVGILTGQLISLGKEKGVDALILAVKSNALDANFRQMIAYNFREVNTEKGIDLLKFLIQHDSDNDVLEYATESLLYLQGENIFDELKRLASDNPRTIALMVVENAFYEWEDKGKKRYGVKTERTMDEKFPPHLMSMDDLTVSLEHIFSDKKNDNFVNDSMKSIRRLLIFSSDEQRQIVYRKIFESFKERNGQSTQTAEVRSSFRSVGEFIEYISVKREFGFTVLRNSQSWDIRSLHEEFIAVINSMGELEVYFYEKDQRLYGEEASDALRKLGIIESDDLLFIYKGRESSTFELVIGPSGHSHPMGSVANPSIGDNTFQYEIGRELKFMNIGVDDASLSKGGIDLNPNNIKMEVQKNGNGVLVPILREPIERFKAIRGFTPVIINVTPINNLPMILGLSKNVESKELSRL